MLVVSQLFFFRIPGAAKYYYYIYMSLQITITRNIWTWASMTVVTTRSICWSMLSTISLKLVSIPCKKYHKFFFITALLHSLSRVNGLFSRTCSRKDLNGLPHFLYISSLNNKVFVMRLCGMRTKCSQWFNCCFLTNTEASEVPHREWSRSLLIRYRLRVNK